MTVLHEIETPGRSRALSDAVDDSAFYGIEHQLHLVDIVGADVRWTLDLEAGWAVFHTGRGDVRARVQVIGVCRASVWTWGWAAPVDPRLTGLSERVHQFGLAHSMHAFTAPHHPLSGHGAIDPNLLTSGAKIIHKSWASYIFNTAPGEQIHAILYNPAWSLPDPDPAMVTDVLTYGPASLGISNLRRAVLSYSNLRGMVRQARKDRSAIRLLGDGWTVTVHFNARGTEIAAVDAAEGPPMNPRRGRHRLEG
jgi:hypothetical protein